MSFAIETDRLLASLWDMMRPNWPEEARRFGQHVDGHPVELGLVVTLDLRMSHYALGGDEYHRSALVHTVFTANTSVFVHASREFKQWREVIPEGWANTSNHDSCWRTDGLRNLHLLQGTFVKEMNEEITADRYSPLAPNEFNQFCSLGTIAGKPWCHVVVEHERIPEENHKRRILSIRSQGGS
jgi:hypothetical protein